MYLCFTNRALRTPIWWLTHVNETSRVKTSSLGAQNNAVLLLTYSVSWIAIITSLTMILSDLITTSSPFFFRGCITALSVRMPTFRIPNTSRAAREKENAVSETSIFSVRRFNNIYSTHTCCKQRPGMQAWFSTVVNFLSASTPPKNIRKEMCKTINNDDKQLLINISNI